MVAGHTARIRESQISEYDLGLFSFRSGQFPVDFQPYLRVARVGFNCATAVLSQNRSCSFCRNVVEKNRFVAPVPVRPEKNVRSVCVLPPQPSDKSGNYVTVGNVLMIRQPYPFTGFIVLAGRPGHPHMNVNPNLRRTLKLAERIEPIVFIPAGALNAGENARFRMRSKELQNS